MESFRDMQEMKFQYPFERLIDNSFFKTDVYQALKRGLYSHRTTGTMGISSVIYQYDEQANNTSSMSGQ